MYKDPKTINDVSTGLDAIKHNIRNILLTPKGSLPGNPVFGSDLYKLPFDQMDLLTKQIARNFVIESVGKFENRIIITDVKVKEIHEFNKLSLNLEFEFRDPKLIQTYGRTSTLNIGMNI